MRNKVKEFWIKSVLEKSLYNQVFIELGLEEKPDVIPTRFPGVEEFPEQSGQILSEGTNVTNIFEEMGAGRTLLILGEPGSGKTITLLKLAQSLIERSEQDISQLIPVVLNLSSWGQKQQPLEKWLIEELKDKYQVPKTWGEPWLKQEQLILLLDGLDEVRKEHREACVHALNKFIVTHNITEMVICSRVKDYEALVGRLQLSSAICIKLLSQQQVYSFLAQAGDSLAGLKKLLQQDRELEQFAQTPLILSIMSWAYRGCSAEKLLQQFRSSEDRYRHLFDSYIERMLRRRLIGQLEQNSNSPKYRQEKVLHWLSWLAKTMVKESQTVFLIEKMQSTLLESRREKRRYRIRNFLIGGLILGLSFGLGGGLFYGLSFGLSGGLFYGLSFGLSGGLNGVLFFGLIYGLFYGLIGGLIGGVIVCLSEEITLFEQMSWSWQKAKSRLIDGLIFGLFFGLRSGLIGGLTYGLFFGFGGLFFGLIRGLIGFLGLGLIGGLFFGLKSGFSSAEVKQRTIPNQGIWNSSKNSIRMGLIFGLILGLGGGLIGGLGGGLFFGQIRVASRWLSELRIYGLSEWLIYGLIAGLGLGLIGGLIGGLMNGGATCIQHFNLRRILYRKGRIPWNCARFLDYASERLLMKKVGGGYIFYHRMLMEHFAQMHLKI